MKGSPIPSAGAKPAQEVQCKNGDTGCKRIPTFVNEKQTMFAEADKQHTVSKPV